MLKVLYLFFFHIHILCMYYIDIVKYFTKHPVGAEVRADHDHHKLSSPGAEGTCLYACKYTFNFMILIQYVCSIMNYHNQITIIYKSQPKILASYLYITLSFQSSNVLITCLQSLAICVCAFFLTIKCISTSQHNLYVLY